MERFEKNSLAPWFGLLSILIAIIFFQRGNVVGQIACLGMLVTVFMVRWLFNFLVICIRTVSLCHSLRRANECSMSEWDDLLED